MKSIINDGVSLAKELANNKQKLCIGKHRQKMLEDEIRTNPTIWIEVASDNGAYQETVGNKIHFPIKGNEYHFMFLADTPSHGDRITYATFMECILNSGGRVFINKQYNITCFSCQMSAETVAMLFQAVSENPVRYIEFAN